MNCISGAKTNHIKKCTNPNYSQLISYSNSATSTVSTLSPSSPSSDVLINVCIAATCCCKIEAGLKYFPQYLQGKPLLSEWPFMWTFKLLKPANLNKQQLFHVSLHVIKNSSTVCHTNHKRAVWHRYGSACGQLNVPNWWNPYYKRSRRAACGQCANACELLAFRVCWMIYRTYYRCMVFHRYGFSCVLLKCLNRRMLFRTFDICTVGRLYGSSCEFQHSPTVRI